MARLPNTATKEERNTVHQAKMAGKIYNRARAAGTRTDIRSRAQLRRLVGTTSIATTNRHTNQPHEHAREIARNLGGEGVRD